MSELGSEEAASSQRGSTVLSQGQVTNWVLPIISENSEVILEAQLTRK